MKTHEHLLSQSQISRTREMIPSKSELAPKPPNPRPLRLPSRPFFHASHSNPNLDPVRCMHVAQHGRVVRGARGANQNNFCPALFFCHQTCHPHPRHRHPPALQKENPVRCFQEPPGPSSCLVCIATTSLPPSAGRRSQKPAASNKIANVSLVTPWAGYET